MAGLLGPGTASEKMHFYNTSAAEIAQGVAVELAPGASFAADKYLFDSIAEEVVPGQLPSGDNIILGVTTRPVPAGQIGELVTRGLVKVVPDNATLIDGNATIITATGEFDDGATGIHTNAAFGKWMEAGVADSLNWIWFERRPDLQ